MKKSGFLTAVFAMIFVFGYAQDEGNEGVKGFDKNKLFAGGNFGLNFGNFTIINVSPQVGYRFNRYLAAGVGINGQYSSLKSRYSDGSTLRESYGVAGLNIFGRVYPIDYLFLQLQPEMNHVWYKEKYTNPSYERSAKQFVPSLLAGAGGAIPTGPGAFIIMAQYDVLQQGYSPYGQRVFFSFGYNMGF